MEPEVLSFLGTSFLPWFSIIPGVEKPSPLCSPILVPSCGNACAVCQLSGGDFLPIFVCLNFSECEGKGLGQAGFQTGENITLPDAEIVGCIWGSAGGGEGMDCGDLGLVRFKVTSLKAQRIQVLPQKLAGLKMDKFISWQEMILGRVYDPFRYRLQIRLSFLHHYSHATHTPTPMQGLACNCVS